MATELIELTADIVIAHASVTEMSPDNLLKEIKAVYATLEGLEQGKIEISDQAPKKRSRKAQGTVEAIAEVKPAIPLAPALTIEEAFKPDQVACMICGKRGMITMKRHLLAAHNLKPHQYRKHFNIPQSQPLAATDYIARRRQAALDKGQLAAARAARKAKQTGE